MMYKLHKNCKIGYGATRTVFLIGNYAIKIPNLQSWRTVLLGLLANMQENLFSSTGWPELCPVVFRIPGGLLTVQKRATILTDDEWSYYGIKYFHNFISRDEYSVPCELKSDSFGWLDGKLVVVDYGN